MSMTSRITAISILVVLSFPGISFSVSSLTIHSTGDLRVFGSVIRTMMGKAVNSTAYGDSNGTCA